MNEQIKIKIFGSALSFLLAGLSIIFAESIPFASILIVIAVIMFVVTTGWIMWESIPWIYNDEDGAKKKAEQIYDLASKNGGVIHATHIFPVDRNPDSDFAIKELSNISNNELTFHRILLLDSIKDENLWLSLLFKRLSDNITIHFYTLSSYPLLLPRIAKALLPRLNLLLYHSPKNKKYEVLVGLDRLHLQNVNVNFALHSRSMRIYRTLLKYFEQITDSGHFKPHTSLKEYKANQPVNSQIQRGQAIISRVVDWAETTPGIIFVGLFGSIAKSAIGLDKKIKSGSTDADVDLIIIYDDHKIRNIKDIQERLSDSLRVLDTKITWGPGTQVFYPYRDKSKIEIDIECFPVGSSFYLDNKLLGFSIFRYFMPLYTVDQQPVVEYLNIPTKPISKQYRWQLLIDDRQGLKFFQKRIKNNPKNTDPSRLSSHILRNLVWALTGYWPTNTMEAINFLLTQKEWRANPNLLTAIELYKSSESEVKQNIPKSFETIKNLIDSIYEFEQKELS